MTDSRYEVWGRTFGALGYEVIVIRTAQKRAKRVSQKMLAFSMTECSRGRRRRQSEACSERVYERAHSPKQSALIANP